MAIASGAILHSIAQIAPHRLPQLHQQAGNSPGFVLK